MLIRAFNHQLGILRCRGRLEHAELSEGSKFPILLPQNGRFTVVIIERVHKQNLHSGVSQTYHKLGINSGYLMDVLKFDLYSKVVLCVADMKVEIIKCPLLHPFCRQ